MKQQTSKLWHLKSRNILGGFVEGSIRIIHILSKRIFCDFFDKKKTFAVFSQYARWKFQWAHFVYELR